MRGKVESDATGLFVTFYLDIYHNISVAPVI